MKENISKTIKDLRAKTGLTQKQFAAKLGMHVNTIAYWEHGHRKPKPHTLEYVKQQYSK